jgi:miniconductance mechanosensitive channel
MQARLDALRALLSPYPWAYSLVVLTALLVIAGLLNFVGKKVLPHAIGRLIGSVGGARLLGERGRGIRLIARLANVLPALVIAGGIRLVPDLSQDVVSFVVTACEVTVILSVALAFRHALGLANELYERRANARDRPIKGYLQVAEIIGLLMAILASVALVVGVEFTHVLTGLGATSAVLMLVFQDTILAFAASLQISSDGRVRIGDWVEMPSQNADGAVIDIALHTVTVRNWDQTITTIPTRKLISDSFKNWRGMTEAGGRRIKRALYLDQHSTRFLTPEEIAKLKRFRLLEGYLRDKEAELREWNQSLGDHAGEAVNQRRITNLGTFRAYVDQYLRHHPGVNKNLALMVRQLQPTPAGLPLEIYCFSADVRWPAYEALQADIFDHLLAILPEFGLRVFQQESDAPREVRVRESSPVQRGDAA